MFWADKILEKRAGEEVINDSWTPSGMIHMGGLKGPILHSTLFRVLKEKNEDTSFIFGFDDADPIDGLPLDLVDSHTKYMGFPISIAPSPDGDGSFGDYFGKKMRKLFDALNIEAKIYKTSELYKDGTFDRAIKFVLDGAEEVRKAYADVYKKDVKKDWFPLQVICPNCGKLGTTKVTGWNGKEIDFCCEENLVSWAKGCGYCGKMSPFGGKGKMPWKVEWPAKWWTLGVTIEGAGKDHMSAGGSYDVSKKIYTDVFKKELPLSFAYEHFLSHGKKMSSSKGIGLTGEELLEMLTPQVARFLMIKTPPNQAIEFTPWSTDIIPKLYDDYQKAADAYFEKKDNDLGRIFNFSQVGEIKRPPKIRFSQIAQWEQMPNMKEEIKKENLEEWAKYARVWIEKYAPESDKFAVKKELPEEARRLLPKQKEFLKKVSTELNKESDAEVFQKNLYEWAKELDLQSKEAFSAIYTALLGKDHGPKASWLILSLDRKFVQNRFSQIYSNDSNHYSDEEEKKGFQLLEKPEIFSIDKELKNKYPSISVGVAIIKEVNIQKENKALEKEKKDLLELFTNLTTEELGQYPEVISYRKLYKAMGVDWHSRRPSPEALLRRIALKKGLYTINTCVDAYNLAVMKNRVSVGAFDLDKIQFPTILRFAKEGEEILLLGDENPTKYKDGEIAYFDQAGGFNMDFNFRDAQRTAVGLETKNVFINVDGIYDITPQKVEEVLKQACDLIIKYCGGKMELFGVETGE
ncbi:lysine--tRNA ligase [Candidatus Microgenomates bacterium]|nr:MAG: lysine--tRNA ligase [Candidatus Microgenomates bacterium]